MNTSKRMNLYTQVQRLAVRIVVVGLLFIGSQNVLAAQGGGLWTKVKCGLLWWLGREDMRGDIEYIVNHICVSTDDVANAPHGCDPTIDLRTSIEVYDVYEQQECDPTDSQVFSVYQNPHECNATAPLVIDVAQETQEEYEGLLEDLMPKLVEKNCPTRLLYLFFLGSGLEISVVPAENSSVVPAQVVVKQLVPEELSSLGYPIDANGNPIRLGISS